MDSVPELIDRWVSDNRARVTGLLRELVRRPSENHPPGGGEAAHFRELAGDSSVYDELLVVRPPKRVVGGVTVRF